MGHYLQHHFLTQYIEWGAPQWMSFTEWYECRLIRMEVAEHRPMNKDYANSWISKLSPLTFKYTNDSIWCCYIRTQNI